jgi:hypothetical protein
VREVAGQHELRRAARSLAAVAAIGAVILSLGACDAPATHPGTVGGDLPTCYGPGPDLNLTPTRVVEVRQAGKLVTREAFRSDHTHLTYELELAPGEYDLAIPGHESIHVQVRSGERTVADLPVTPCL